MSVKRFPIKGPDHWFTETVRQSQASTSLTVPNCRFFIIIGHSSEIRGSNPRKDLLQGLARLKQRHPGRIWTRHLLLTCLMHLSVRTAVPSLLIAASSSMICLILYGKYSLSILPGMYHFTGSNQVLHNFSLNDKESTLLRTHDNFPELHVIWYDLITCLPEG